MATEMDRIVQVGKYYPPEVGGIENNVQQLAQAASESYSSVVVCMRKGVGPARSRLDGNVSIRELRSFGSIWRQEITEAPNSLFHQIHPSVIHFHTPNPLLAFPVIRYVEKHPDVRLVVSHHADLNRPLPIRSLANVATRRLLSRAENIICYTATFARESKELKAYLSKVTILPHGVGPPSRQVEPRLIHSGAKLKLGFLGRVEKWKGIDLLLDAVANDNDLSLLVGGSGGYLDAAQATANGQESVARISFLGKLSGADRESFFEQIDALVLPSLNAGESYGQVLVEAQLRGIPVVASDLPTGVREVCDFGRAGILFKTGDLRALHAAMDRLRDPATYAKFAAAGQLHAKDNYCEAVVLPKIPEFYRNVLNRSAN